MGEKPYDIIGLGLAFVLNGAIGFAAIRDYLSRKKLINKLEKAPMFNNSMEIYDRVHRSGMHTIPYAIVTGRVYSTESPIRNYDGSEGVFSKFIVKQHNRTRQTGGHWTNEVVPMQTISKSVKFGLIESYIKEGNSPKGPSEWVVHRISEDHPESTLMQLSSVGAQRYLETGDELGERVGDKIAVAVEQTERMLKNYTMVTLSGALTVDDRGLIELSVPPSGLPYMVFNGTAKDAIEGHRSINNIILAVCIISGSLALFIGGAIVYRVWQSRRPKPSMSKDGTSRASTSKTIFLTSKLSSTYAY